MTIAPDCTGPEVVALRDPGISYWVFGKDTTGVSVNFDTLTANLFTSTPVDSTNALCNKIRTDMYTDEALTTEWPGSPIFVGSTGPMPWFVNAPYNRPNTAIDTTALISSTFWVKGFHALKA